MIEKLNIFVAEDDVLFAKALEKFLKKLGHRMTMVRNFQQAASILGRENFQLAIIDLTFAGNVDGINIAKYALANNIYSVILSSRDEDELVEEAYSLGCNDFLRKFDYQDELQKILIKLQKTITQRKLGEFIKGHGYWSLDEDLQNSLDNINESQSLFLGGPTGVGKTSLARLIHLYEKGENFPFVNLNCSEIPPQLFESELFGHKKGSFTGADQDKKGLIEGANGGTLFLDEITTLPLNLQVKLLKVLEEKTFYPIGSTKPQYSDFRLICASCEDPMQMIKNNTLREDFYFRIAANKIILKPLFQRQKDIDYLIEQMIKKSPRRIILKKDGLDLLLNYHWPGNVRELKQFFSNLMYKQSGIIDKASIKNVLFPQAPAILQNSSDSSPLTQQQQLDLEKFGLKKFIQNLEHSIVKNHLKENQEKVRPTIKSLQISTSAFYRIMNLNQQL
ncbi:MAG: sigma-54-dependent transcriptional regulator [Bacteriovoracia bacterium]